MPGLFVMQLQLDGHNLVHSSNGNVALSGYIKQLV